MKRFPPPGLVTTVILIGMLGGPTSVAHGQPPRPDPATDDRAKLQEMNKKDSFRYYGPNNLWQYWHDPKNTEAASQRLGRDTWIHWTWGNQKVLRHASVIAGNLPVPVSIDFFRLLDSRNRGTRFRDLGLINEPNCKANDKPDEYGLYLDTWEGDDYYPVEYDLKTGKYTSKEALKYPNGKDVDLRHFGRPSGIVGIRLFTNQLFDPKKWDLNEYFKNPGKVEPPYLVGFSFAICHIAFDPKNPPDDPENPSWRNLAANIGNQYLREGELFLGKGRITFGDKNPDPMFPGDPYKTRGLGANDFLYHYAVTQQPGTSETSRFSYDFINNPNTITPIWGLQYRPKFTETNTWGKQRPDAWHALKDGSDAIGPEWALMRVPINIGCEGDYWIDQLFNPLTGRRQRPLQIRELLAGLQGDERKAVEDKTGFNLGEVPPARLLEIEARYHSPWGSEKVGQDWQEAWRRVPYVKAYLESYYWPTKYEQAAGVAQFTNEEKAAAKRGAKLFGQNCARCHSSKPPLPPNTDPKAFFETSAQAPEFLDYNFLADENRYPVYPRIGDPKKPFLKDDPDPPLGTNLARALATNAIHRDIWAEFSSREYKALTPLAPLSFNVPVFPLDPRQPGAVQPPITVPFEPPGEGRGYYRTPSLISVWTTAPYLHNNSVGDYYVYTKDGGKPDGQKKSFWVSTDGTMWREKNTDRWLPRPNPAVVDYWIDTSVDGRVKMFEDGMWKLLNPAQRHRWVKRTSAPSALIPDLGTSLRQLVASVALDVIVGQVRTLLKERQVPPAQVEEVVRAIDGAIRRSIADALKDSEVTVRFAWSALQVRTRDHGDRVFDLLFDDLRVELADKLKFPAVAFDRLKLPLRRAFLDQLDRLDERLREASFLKIPAGIPVNLYANLNPSAAAYAALAHVRLRDDPRALAEALLQLSDCPDLVEDSGHTYGSGLSDAEKKDLIAFLKTF